MFWVNGNSWIEADCGTASVEGMADAAHLQGLIERQMSSLYFHCGLCFVVSRVSVFVAVVLIRFVLIIKLQVSAMIEK